MGGSPSTAPSPPACCWSMLSTVAGRLPTNTTPQRPVAPHPGADLPVAGVPLPEPTPSV